MTLNKVRPRAGAVLIGLLALVGLSLPGAQAQTKDPGNATDAVNPHSPRYGHPYRHGAHLSMDSLRNMFPRRLARAFDYLIEILWVWFAVALAWLSWKVSEVAKLQSSPGLEMPMSYVYYGMVVGGAYLLLVVLRRIVLREKPLSPQ